MAESQTEANAEQFETETDVVTSNHFCQGPNECDGQGTVVGETGKWGRWVAFECGVTTIVYRGDLSIAQEGQ